jgi:hypothetical protein
MVLCMSEQVKFWRDQSRWPRDHANYTFLCRAVHRVGKCLFDEWTGSEPHTPIVKHLPEHSFYADDSTKSAAYELLRANRPDLQLPYLKFGFRREFDENLWQMAREIQRPSAEKSSASNQRFFATKKWIFEALAKGEVHSSLRPQSGGQFSAPCPNDWWNFERWDNRFYWGKMHPHDPFGVGVGGDNFQWIFILSDSLEVALNQHVGPKATITKFPELNGDRPTEVVKPISNRPPMQRDAAKNYLKTIAEPRLADKIDSLIADMAEKTHVTVSKDTMRRARKDLNAEG